MLSFSFMIPTIFPLGLRNNVFVSLQFLKHFDSAIRYIFKIPFIDVKKYIQVDLNNQVMLIKIKMILLNISISLAHLKCKGNMIVSLC